MDNYEQIHHSEEVDDEKRNDAPTEDEEKEERDDSSTENEYDYDREPLDHATASSNRQRSKYVFMTLCFLLALVLFYTYITSGNSNDWIPLVGAIALGIMGIVFLRSSDNPPRELITVESSQAMTMDDGNAVQSKTLSFFEELVQEALVAIPEEFQEKMANVMVHVEYEPDEKTLTRLGVSEGHTLLGLYEGVPLTTYGYDSTPYPEIITIYQRPIEDYCRHNPTRIREQVRSTVLHEVAHHFGMGHAEMPIWLK